MCLSAIVGGASALLGASSANKAASAQQAAADKQLALQERIYDDTVERFNPYYNAGLDAQAALMYELGLGEAPMVGGSTPEITTIAGGRTANWGSNALSDSDDPVRRLLGFKKQPDTYSVNGQIFDTMEQAQAYANANKTGGTQYQGYELEPGYQWQIDQGLNALGQSAAAKGQLQSSWSMNNSQRLAQGIADTGRQNYLNRLASAAAGGQSAAGNQAQAGQAYASGGSNALANYGNAASAGAIGVNNAIQGGLNNALGIWQYQNAMGGGNNSLFGNSWS